MDKLTPRAAQSERIERFLAEPTKAGALADEMGVGKSLVAVEIALKFQRTLTVGVRDTADQFRELIEAQSDGAIVLRVVDSTKSGKLALEDLLAGKDGHYFAGSQYLTRQDYESRPVLDAVTGKRQWKMDKKTSEVIVKESDAIGPRLIPVPLMQSVQLHTYKRIRPFDVVIWDEVHVLQNRKSAAFRTAKTLPSERKLGMSGTIYGNKFAGMWAICRWLWPTIIDGSFLRWQRDWCATKTVYLPGGKTAEEVTGERFPGEFVKTLPLYIRSEAEPLPPAIEVFVDLTPAQRHQYDELEEQLVTWINDNPLVADLPPTLRQRLRTAALGEMSVTEDGEVYFADDCRSSKLQALGGILNGYWGGREQVLIGMDSKKFAYITHDRMKAAGESVGLWTGDTSSKERADLKARFLAGEVQYLVNTIGALSTGVDGFQRVASKAVLLSELDGNEAINQQWIRRLFRPGRVGNYELVRILARGTKDEGVYGSNLARSINNRQTMRLAA